MSLTWSLSLLAETLLAVESPVSDDSSTTSDTETDTSDSDSKSSKYEEGTQMTGFSQRVMQEVHHIFNYRYRD
jgi:hypothetical protein